MNTGSAPTGFLCSSCGHTNSRFDVTCRACKSLLVAPSLEQQVRNLGLDERPVGRPERTQWSGVTDGTGRRAGLVIGSMVSEFIRAIFRP
jgi:hypothetical protein